MSDEPFTLDTHLLVYSIDLKAADRRELAKQIIRRSALRPCFLAVQAISEFYAAVTRKRMMRPSQAGQSANDLMDVFPTIPAPASAVRAALAAAVAGQASYWDALLVATAAEAGCTTILTEDLADGSHLFGVRILNPFAGDTLTPEAAALLATN